MKPLTESIRFRASSTDKRIALRLANREHRTLSNFLINLIHERQALVNRQLAAQISVDGGSMVPAEALKQEDQP